MNKESKINLNASDYAISHCDSDKTYNGLEVHKMLCDAYIAGNLDDKDEKIRKALINVFATHKDYEIFFGVSVENIIAWLEKQNHDGKKWIYEDAYIKEREQLFQDGIDEVLENPQKYGLEKQGKQKSVWHDENEEPIKGSLILIITPSGTPVVAKVIEPNHTFDSGERWAYIDDLLKK